MDDRQLCVRNVSIRAVLAGLLATVSAVGCGGGKEFPLSVGKSWSYMVDSGFGTTRVEEVKVLREVSVDGVKGFELGGNMGQSRLAWKDGVLLAAQLPNATFNPPIPLIVGGEAKARKEWKGLIGAMGKGSHATAVLVQEPSKDTFSGHAVQTTKSTLTIVSGAQRTELITWFKNGEGPIKQEQRTNNILVVKFEQIPD
jgi:hypothetical protein